MEAAAQANLPISPGTPPVQIGLLNKLPMGLPTPSRVT